MADTRRGGRKQGGVKARSAGSRARGGNAPRSSATRGPEGASPGERILAGAPTARTRSGKEPGGTSPGSRNSAEAPAARTGADSAPGEAIFKLTELEQIKVLADPLRIRILELLCEERTTKQVAVILGQPPTRLYHHVAALERVGLIRLARTKQSRGALEKYYVAVARAFSADPRLFSSPAAAQAREATHGVAVQLLENTAADLRALLESGESPDALAEGGVLSFLEVRGTVRELRAIREKLLKILKDCAAGKGKPGAAGPGYRLTIAYFPLAGRPRSS